MAASLLRLHFHDCFVMGCDASILLDSYGEMVSEKEAEQNKDSLRGFELIDSIKYRLEEACPCTVSCADILAIAARDAVSLRGGPRWQVWLGRRDSLEASFTGANLFIPSPNSSLEMLIANFKDQGLDISDLAALSGSHTMGRARCLSFRERIYHDSDNDQEHNQDTHKLHTTFRKILRSMCPESGRDYKLAPLDFNTPAKFDNNYFHNILQGRGLLHSDNVLITEDIEGEMRRMVWDFASHQHHFFSSFVNSMVKMGNINVLTGDQGEVRKNCRYVNI
ncbi:peroxidase 20 isoform X2 [Malania oleifera]|nr:peroxidase 20 isoform X2 [Malania oleifera]